MMNLMPISRNQLLQDFFYAQQQYEAAVRAEVDFYDLRIIRSKITSIVESIEKLDPEIMYEMNAVSD